MKPTCPFSKKVMATAEELGIKLELKDIKENETIAAELEEKGGKRQVPYLVDQEKGESMYESDRIVSYLKENYGQGKAVRVHQSDETCDDS